MGLKPFNIFDSNNYVANKLNENRSFLLYLLYLISLVRPHLKMRQYYSSHQHRDQPEYLD